ncbi:hypothetical protein [Streptomyces zingiberis]|uniref:Uncharacterized protein n=1 Tax=Streptomyces zingiberis TaxID=2053010 RepID=A0ABX1BR77_9ACTN|nr:hypothetical protein [Streptomyces zingiberis]NJP99074.1 hypothetical protein [Streptomyces zingiberis]
MGWTHDYRDVSRDHRTPAARNAPPGVASPGSPGRAERPSATSVMEPPGLGIPHILRRRARWVSARLRHPRD